MKIHKLQYFFLLVFLLFVGVQHAAAQTSVNQPTLPPSANTTMPSVNYDLPYPGILPNNPLYFFKVIRDNAIGFLISDPAKKSEYNLFQSDKRLEAAVLLETNGNTDQKLVADTLGKSGNYFSEAITSVASAKQQGINVQFLVSNLDIASKKHIQILQTMPSSGPAKAEALAEQKRFAGFEKQIESYMHSSNNKK